MIFDLYYICLGAKTGRGSPTNTWENDWKGLKTMFLKEEQEEI